MIRLVVFDVGNTLYVPHWPSIGKAHEAQVAWLRKKGVSFTVEQLDVAFNYANARKQNLKRMAKPYYITILQMKHLGVPVSWASPLIHLFYAVRLKHEGKRGLSLGVQPLLSYLKKRKIAMGIISNADLSWAREWVIQHNLPIPSSHILVSHEARVRKPAKKVFDIYFKRMQERIKNLKREEILMVGDRDNDLAAKKAGFQTCLYNPKGKKKSEFAFKPDFIISHFSELKKII